MMKTISFITFLFVSLHASAELRVCSNDSYQYLDPHQAQNTLEKQLATVLIYETVVKYDPLNKKLVPFLIKRWSSYNDNTIYKLYFERDISFISPIKVKEEYKLSAEDFLFSLNLYLEKIKEGKVIDNYARSNIKKVEILEPKVVSISLNKSDPDFMKNLAEKMGLVLSKNYYQDLKKKNKLSEFYKNPVGTGAYRYKKINPKELRLYRQDAYHFGIPDAQEIVFNQVKSKDRREKYLKSDLCDIAVDISSNSLPKGFELHENKTDIFFFFEQNKKSPLNRITKFHPLYNFLNFKAVAQTISPAGESATAFVPSESKLFEKSNFSYKFNPKGMDKVFKKYGVSKLKLYFDKDAQDEVHSLNSFLNLIKKSFSDIGVEITLAQKGEADLFFRKMTLNGFYEKGLKSYFFLWKDKRDEKWFNFLFSQLGKNAYTYPVVYDHFYIGTSPKISKFYSFRSNNFDLTTIKLTRVREN